MKFGYKQLVTQDTSRGPSGSIWADWDAQTAHDEAGGDMQQASYEFFDDFDYGVAALQNTVSAQGTAATTGSGSYGRWGYWMQSSSGLIGQAADYTNLPFEGGWLGLVSGASGSVISLQALGGHGFGFVSASSSSGNFRGKMWFECSVALSSLVSTGNGLFIGLAGADGGSGNTAISANGKLISSTTASGLVNTNSFFGFYKPSASPLVNAANPSKTLTGSLFNDFLVAYNVAAGTIQFPGSASNLWTLLTNTGFNPTAGAGTVLSPITFTAGAITTPASMKVKLGWVFDPTHTCSPLAATAAITSNQTVGTTYAGLLTFYVNGQRSGSFLINTDIQSSTFPSVWMNPVIAFQAGAGTAGIAYIDWVRCAQLGSY